jgi:hypothetical protein
LRLRLLAEAATTIVLILDANEASIGDIEAVRQEIGRQAGKIEGFVWINAES